MGNDDINIIDNLRQVIYLKKKTQYLYCSFQLDSSWIRFDNEVYVD